jgi:hypothetical protein
MPAEIASDAEAGDPANPSADFLNRRHQRIAEYQRPSQAIPQLRADL